MKAILMRHASAAWPDGVADPERPLSEQGVDEARRVGRRLRDDGWIPERIITSPAKRAVQTGAAVAEAFDVRPETATAMPLYEGGQAAYRNELFSSLHTILVVGHNPAVEDLARSLGADLDAGCPPATAVLVEDRTAVRTVRPDDIE